MPSRGESNYSKVLTIVLIIIIIATLIMLGFLGFDVFEKIRNKQNAEEGVQTFENEVSNRTRRTNTNTKNEETNSSINDRLNMIGNMTENTVDPNSTSGGGSGGGNSKKKVETYKGYPLAGKIEIPAIDLEYPLLDSRSAGAIEVAVAISYTQNGVNQPGNTVIIGHNYRNGSFFGNNDRLKNGDLVYITDMDGNRVKYEIYQINNNVAPEESSYFTKDTGGAREIVLATCTDNSKGRLVIFAKEK
jgi:LPXTG-site transpeptidase (sortase) family protein